jgi:hypothetical protein
MILRPDGVVRKRRVAHPVAMATRVVDSPSPRRIGWELLQVGPCVPMSLDRGAR